MGINLLRHFGKRLPINVLRIITNCWPPFCCTGIRIKIISPDYRYVEIAMKLKWYNKNYVGTDFGGAIYSMTDPFYMLMLINNLGKDYIVWDKAATINFKKPGRGTLTAIFKFSEEEIQEIREKTDQQIKYIFDRPVDVIDEEGDIVASIVKTLYVRRKDPA